MSLGQREKTQQCWISKIPDYPSFPINGSIGVWDPPNCDLGQKKIYQNFENLPELQVEGKTHRENRAKFFEYVFLWGGGQIRAKYSHLGRKFEQIM